jgi:hypothetical protein
MTISAWKKLSCGLTASFALASAQLASAPTQAANYDINSFHVAPPSDTKGRLVGHRLLTDWKDPEGPVQNTNAP